ncbi:methylmalonyl-CoA mutase family protein [Acuticoccus sp. M5D2P5]|uniref:methylmalonyl-CoA mutase family protein n=1 Tax=Acuticoccus kalidii TaxID=2910977 RepID=UPI001F392464|nr:methylmalonyl-CoA mutase family protein [Acuticoccus kalidii]MCF3935580.1 methylmalonyl-CoA mutase family protein [Acuticoccus kalidii]
MVDTVKAGADAWRALVDKALKGAPFETLTTTTADGAVLQPLYRPAEPVYSGRASHGRWDIVQRVDTDANAAAQAREDLESGANALSIVFAGAPSAFGGGLSAGTVTALDSALDGVHLGLFPVHLEAGANSIAALTMFIALAESRASRPQYLHAGIDPIGAFAATGTMAHPDTLFPRLAQTVRTLIDLAPEGTLVRADGRIVAEAGATPAEELAFALASVTAMLRALDKEGIAAETILPRIEMTLTATADQFATIAKFRAARRLFALVAEACGVNAPLTLNATTAARMLSLSDPQTNLLRLTIAAFAAGVGGADAVTVLPFDGIGSPFARRMSRNIQTLLLEESHVDAIADPGAGSGAIEAYTDTIAAAAWEKFQAHDAGGLIERIADGTVARIVGASAEREAAALAAGEAVMIGVTRHPPETKTPIAVRPASAMPLETYIRPDSAEFGALLAAAMGGASIADLAGALANGDILTAPAIAPSRVAAPLEG